MSRPVIALAICAALLTACGSEYQPYTSAPESATPALEALIVRAGPNSTGTGTVGGGGIDCSISGATFANRCAASLSRGKVVTLQASATGGSTFLAWGEACAASGSTPTCTVTASDALSVSASFAAAAAAPASPPPPPPTPTVVTYAVTVRAGTGGTGSGAVSGAGISCTISGTSQSGDCSESLAQGTQLTLTAAAADSGSFVGWGGACASAGATASCTITVNQAMNVDASFASLATPATPPPPAAIYVLTVRAGATSGGTGTISGTGISCSISATSQSSDCSEPFREGTQLTIKAAATGGSSFAGWGGACAAAGTQSSCALTVNQNTSVDASFAPPPKYVVTVVAGSSGTGTGTVTGPGFTCSISATSQSGDCSEELVQGTQLQLTSSATGGGSFSGWGGACSAASSAATCTITVTQATSIGASFTAPPPPNLAGFWSGTDAGTNIHYHITFDQSGATLSLASCDAGNCRLSALSSTGSGWLGASYLDMASLSGTSSVTSVSFSMNLGTRTVTFSGVLTSPTEMVGQVSGPAMPAQSLTLDRQ